MFDFLPYIEFLKFKPLSNTGGCYCSVIQDITGKELNKFSREGAWKIHAIFVVQIFNWGSVETENNILISKFIKVVK